MNRFQDVRDFIRLAKSAENLSQLSSLVEGAAKSFGFAYFMLGHHANTLRVGSIHLSNYPLAYVEEMSQRAHISDDPVIRACRSRSASFRWSELRELIPFSRYQEEIFTSAKRAGIGEGITVPASVPGERVGSCSFALRTGQRFDDRILPGIQCVGAFAFEAARRLTKIAAHSCDVSREISLSPRQLECVLLVAQGKSDWDIGKMLGLNKSTVHEYIENAKRKYGVASRIQLVLRTLLDNQIGFDDVVHH